MGLGRVGIWAGDFDLLSAAAVRKAAAAIEDLGYGTLWFPETTGREAMAQAAVLLAATRRITVAAGMTDIYARDAVTAALEPGMLALAAERTRGATVLGMPTEYTRTSRKTLGDDRLLAVTQLCVLSHDPYPLRRTGPLFPGRPHRGGIDQV